MFEDQFSQFAKGLPTTTPEEIAAYRRHFEILTEWNAKMNLVSRRSFDKAFANHYADSLFISSFAEPFVENRPVFDLGTGAGFPGLVFAIRNLQSKILLLDRGQKKQTFLSDAVSRLGLKNVRLENELPTKPVYGFFFARAVLPPLELFGYFSKHLKTKSRFVVNLGGKNRVDVIPAGFRRIFECSYSLPLDCGERRIEIFECST